MALTWVFVIGCKHKFVRMAHPERMTSPLVTTEIEALVNSWRRDLRARNLAPETIKTYGESADRLFAHLGAEGVTMAAGVSREDVSDFITDLLATRSASTASVRFRALQQFFTWLVDGEETGISPMAKRRGFRVGFERHGCGCEPAKFQVVSPTFRRWATSWGRE